MPLDLKPSREFLKGMVGESTILSPDEEREYQQWIKHYKLPDIDPKTGEPYSDVKYDMRGYWKANRIPGQAGHGPIQIEGQHGPDTFKQHGHETFSQESKYSQGPSQGGLWIGPTFLEQPPMAVSHSSYRHRKY
jgi:hypothetical protein